MGLSFKFNIFLIFTYGIYFIKCNTKNVNASLIERRAYLRKREAKARKEFFSAFRRMQYDLHKIRKSKPGISMNKKKFPRFMSGGLFFYCNGTMMLRFLLNGRQNAEKIEFVESDKTRGYELYPMLLGGLVFDFNVGKYSGLSIVGGYSLYRRCQGNLNICLENGISVIVSFKVRNMPFPVNILTDYVPNLIDPIFWICYAFGFIYKTEILVGFRFSFWSTSDSRKLNFKLKHNTFRRLKKFIDKRHEKELSNLLFNFFNEYMNFERRVYLGTHFFYSLNSSIIAPFLISALQNDCKNTFKWFKENYLYHIFNFSIGILI